MNEKILDEIVINLCTMIFGDEEYYELGKEKSEWYQKIFEGAANEEEAFLNFVVMCIYRFQSTIGKEELMPTTSLLFTKYRNKQKEKRKQATVDFINGKEFDNFCKIIYYSLKENENGNH